MQKIDRIEHAIDLLDGVSATIEAVPTVKGPKGELSREYQSSRVTSCRWRRSSGAHRPAPPQGQGPCRHLERPHQQHGEGQTEGFSYTLRCFYLTPDDHEGRGF